MDCAGSVRDLLGPKETETCVITRKPDGMLPRCATNFRDVAANVPSLRQGILFRSDMVAGPDEDDAEFLRSCGIRLVFDLRSASERAAQPNTWWREAGAEVAEFEVAGQANPTEFAATLSSNPGVAGAHALMCAAYASFTQGAVSMLRHLGERLETGHMPVLIHCTAGKDRTGVTVAFLLLALGIEPEIATRDYLASQGRMNPRAADATREIMASTYAGSIDDAAIAHICGVHEDFLASALGAAQASHGSLKEYFAQANLDDARRQRLRSQLLIA
jgi:protein-tyrosine phosphatase